MHLRTLCFLEAVGQFHKSACAASYTQVKCGILLELFLGKTSGQLMFALVRDENTSLCAKWITWISRAFCQVGDKWRDCYVSGPA